MEGEPNNSEQERIEARKRHNLEAVHRYQLRKKPEQQRKAEIQRVLKAGREIQLKRLQAERREWDAIVWRVNGASLIEIADKLGFGKSRKRVRTAIRSVDLPEGKRYLCDRGQPFTRGSGVDLYRTLNQPQAVFARLVSTPTHTVREHRITIWYTNRKKNLTPIEAQACIDLRDKIARKLLAQDGGRGRYSYDRREVLAALFPRFRDEYKTLGQSLRGIGALLEENPGANKSDIADFVLQRAKEEVKGKLDAKYYRELIRWLPERPPDGKEVPEDRLPQLMPVILAHRAAIARTNKPHRIAFEVLADTMGAPARILRDAIEEGIEAASPEKMALIILREFPEFAQPTAAIRPKVSDRKKRGTAENTPRRLYFMAAWNFLKLGTYGLAKKLYTGKPQENAEASTRSLLKYHAEKLKELEAQMDEQKAKTIVEAGL